MTKLLKRPETPQKRGQALGLPAKPLVERQRAISGIAAKENAFARSRDI